jgi:hypothetical protein
MAVRREERPSELTHQPTLSLSGVLVGGVLPGAAPGIELTTRLPLDAAERVALRAGVLYLPERRDRGEIGDLGYGLTLAEIGACLGQAGRRTAVYGCMAFGAGAAHVVVHAPVPLEPGDRFWASLRAEAGFMLRAAGPVWVDLRVFDLFPLTPQDFRVVTEQGRKSAFKQSRFMPGAALGVGLRFQ